MSKLSSSSANSRWHSRRASSAAAQKPMKKKSSSSLRLTAGSQGRKAIGSPKTVVQNLHQTAEKTSFSPSQLKAIARLEDLVRQLEINYKLGPVVLETRPTQEGRLRLVLDATVLTTRRRPRAKPWQQEG